MNEIANCDAIGLTHDFETVDDRVCVEAGSGGRMYLKCTTCGHEAEIEDEGELG